MARFRGTMAGNRGQVSRLGTKSSGISAKINGWNSGVNIEARVENDDDVFYIYPTSGSDGYVFNRCIGKILHTQNGVEFIPA